MVPCVLKESDSTELILPNVVIRVDRIFVALCGMGLWEF